MLIAVLGTGAVGRGHAERLLELGHRVRVGTRDPARGRPDLPDGEPATFAEAVRGADLVINALNGSAAADVLAGIAGELDETVVLDLANPLDLSSGELRLTVCNTDSLGERIQRAVPRARVVKTLCTVNVEVQVRPRSLAGGDHAIFVAGDDVAAKATVSALLRDYGWTTIVDVGDLTGARGMEMLVPMWVRLYEQTGTARFNYRLVVDDPGPGG